ATAWRGTVRAAARGAALAARGARRVALRARAQDAVSGIVQAGRARLCRPRSLMEAGVEWGSGRLASRIGPCYSNLAEFRPAVSRFWAGGRSPPGGPRSVPGRGSVQAAP